MKIRLFPVFFVVVVVLNQKSLCSRLREASKSEIIFLVGAGNPCWRVQPQCVTTTRLTFLENCVLTMHKTNLTKESNSGRSPISKDIASQIKHNHRLVLHTSTHARTPPPSNSPMQVSLKTKKGKKKTLVSGGSTRWAAAAALQRVACSACLACSHPSHRGASTLR